MIQDNILSAAQADKQEIRIITINGYQRVGVVTGFDDDVIVLESDGKRQTFCVYDCGGRMNYSDVQIITSCITTIRDLAAKGCISVDINFIPSLETGAHMREPAFIDLLSSYPVAAEVKYHDSTFAFEVSVKMLGVKYFCLTNDLDKFSEYIPDEVRALMKDYAESQAVIRAAMKGN